MFFPKIEQSWHIFLQNTNGSWQGFTNSGGSYYQNSISVKFWFCMASYFYQHFHETLLHCDSKHLFPFLLSQLIFHRKPRRFYTYIHELLECNIASHTFFWPRLVTDTIIILDILFTSKSHLWMFHGHFVLLTVCPQNVSYKKSFSSWWLTSSIVGASFSVPLL